jgi:hypothetical protein
VVGCEKTGFDWQVTWSVLWFGLGLDDFTDDESYDHADREVIK